MAECCGAALEQKPLPHYFRGSLVRRLLSVPKHISTPRKMVKEMVVLWGQRGARSLTSTFENILVASWRGLRPPSCTKRDRGARVNTILCRRKQRRMVMGGGPPLVGEWASSEVVQRRKKSDQISVREDDLRKMPRSERSGWWQGQWKR